jgi:hypothetical protein
MAGAAAAEGRLTFGRSEHIQISGVRHELEYAIDGRQSDGLAAFPEQGMHLLGAAEVVDLSQQ